MRIKAFALAAVLACIPLVGCSLAVPEEEEKGEELIGEAFTDMCAGLVFSLSNGWATGDFEQLTSEKIGDETCVALWLDYTYDRYGIFSSGISGNDYLFKGNIVDHMEDSGSTCSASGEIYLNAELGGDLCFSFDSLSRNEAGDLTSDGAACWYNTNGVGEQTTTAETKQEIKQTETIDGETTVTTKTMTLRVSLTVKFLQVGTDWRILQYDEEGSLLSATPVSETGEGSFALAEGCAFLVSEETVAGEKRRTLYEREDGVFPAVEFFCDGGIGLLKRIEFTAKEA